MFVTFPRCDLAVGNGPKNAKTLSEREKGIGTCLAQMAIFSLANGGSGTKSLPLSSSDVGIMKVKGVLWVPIFIVEVEDAMFEFMNACCEGEWFFCIKCFDYEARVKKFERERGMGIYRSSFFPYLRHMENVCITEAFHSQEVGELMGILWKPIIS